MLRNPGFYLMKVFLKKCIFTISVLSFFSSMDCLAQDPSAEGYVCGSPKVLMYINGITNTEDDGYLSLWSLEAYYYYYVLQSGVEPDQLQRAEFRLMYNPTHGFVWDIIEASLQALLLANWRISDYLLGGRGLDAVNDLLYEARLASLQRSPIGNSEEKILGKLTNDLRKEIALGSDIVIVSHSQGNLWSNIIVQSLTLEERNSIAQIGVALPERKMEHSLIEPGYITLEEDWFMKITPTAAPANISNGYTKEEIDERNSGHNFVGAYMEWGKPSQKYIMEGVIESFKQLSPNRIDEKTKPMYFFASVASDPILAPLDNLYGILDLRVQEPSYYTTFEDVYYGNPNGDSGDLWGPGHYVTSCETLQEGSYRVGLGLKPGTGLGIKGTASSTISAGFAKVDFSIPLRAPICFFGFCSDEMQRYVTVYISRHPVTGLFLAKIYRRPIQIY